MAGIPTGGWIMAAVLQEEVFVEARIARLESDVANLKVELGALLTNDFLRDIRAMSAALNAQMDKLLFETRVGSAFVLLCLLFQIVTHAFHWLGM
jgi:hypothetical protein